MVEETEIVPVAAERFSRLRTAMALASEGKFKDADALLESPPEDAFGEVELAVRAFISDHRIALEQSALSIEEFKASKQELLEKIATIEEQRAAIQRLSAPIIDVWDDVVTVPLIGLWDGVRAQDLTERLLARIPRMRTAWVLLDMTGTDRVDSMIGEHLMRLTGAVRLMGAQCLVTGMRAHVAQTLVSLGTSLGSLRPISSLKDGLKYCLSSRSAGGGGQH